MAPSLLRLDAVLTGDSPLKSRSQGLAVDLDAADAACSLSLFSREYFPMSVKVFPSDLQELQIGHY